MHKLLIPLAALILVATGLFLVGSATIADAGSVPQATLEADHLAAQGWDWNFEESDAHLSGSWCYITCADGSPTTRTTSFSISHCCNECADACNTGCVATGRGPSVICGNE